jgi:predicted RNA binding protein YcfA (HicA-like mRNA interferase family)
LNKEVRQLLKRLRKSGFAVEQSAGKQHFFVTLDGKRVAVVPSSPSDWRWKKNVISDIRRETGVDLR